MFKGRNILIAGGTGFIGANLVKKFVELGANVRATLHKREPIIKDDRVDYVKADLLNMEDCRNAVRDMEFVYQCAANTSGAAIIATTPLVHVTPNIIMNSQLIEASYFAKAKKFIFISSNAAYPDTKDRSAKEDEMYDGDPYDLYFGVGWMKRFTEILCKLYSEKLKEKMQTVVIRPSNIYGPYDDYDFATSHMMAATIRKVVERQNPINVWGTGNDVRDLIYIDDFVEGVLLATQKLEKYEPVNIALGKGYSVKQIINFCLKIDDFNGATVNYDPSKPSMIPFRLIDTSKAEKLLGFKAKTDVLEGIEKTIKWYKEYYK